MPGEDHAELLSDVMLHPLDRVVFEFNDFAAVLADEMVMMVLARNFKTGLIFVEVALSQQLALLEQFEGSINRRVADVRIYLLDLSVEFFRTHMSAEFKKDPSDIVARRRRFKATVTQSRMKQLHSLLRLARAGMLPTGRTYVTLSHDPHPVSLRKWP